MKTASSQFAEIRKQLEADDQLKSLVAGLRGSNLNDSDYAEEGVTMSLVEVSALCKTCPHVRGQRRPPRYDDYVFTIIVMGAVLPSSAGYSAVYMSYAKAFLLIQRIS